MDEKQPADIASEQLNRVLGFFPRVEGKISALFAIDAGMLGLLTVNARFSDVVSIWYLGFGYAGSLLLLGASIWFLYKASFPNLDGGSSSLVYFKTIGEMTEPGYKKRVAALTEAEWEEDLLGQVWRNSQILSAKYKDLKRGFVCTALSLLPWTFALFFTVQQHNQISN